MKLWKNIILFYLGGMAYCGLELLWRGRTHGSMFLLGGGCFLMLGKVGRLRLPLPLRAILGGALITAGELAVGLAVNSQFQVWDYRHRPFHFQGQICPLFSFFWILLSPVGWLLYRQLQKRLPGAASKAFPRGEGGRA